MVLTPAFDPHVGWPQQNKMGDYFDMNSDDLGADLAYAATFNGEQDVYYIRIGIRCSDAGTVTLDSPSFACEDIATVAVNDCGLNTDDELVETVEVTIHSDSEPTPEAVLLTETGPATSLFRGTIALSGTNAPGVLFIAEGDTVTATYIDADDGEGGANIVVTTTALVDCTLPIISNVQTTDIEARQALVTFDIDEPSRGVVRYGYACGILTESASNGAYVTGQEVLITGLDDDTTYYYVVDAEDQAGNIATDDNGGDCYTFTTPQVPDFFTELFESDNDLDNRVLTFAPDGSSDFYCGISDPITQLPIDPTGGTVITLSDDSSVAITPGQTTVALYGQTYSSFYVGSNGYITFGTSDTSYSETLDNHFSKARIAALYDDLNPSTVGTVSWKQGDGMVAVTYDGVPEYSSTNPNTFQIIMWEDGTIQIAYLGIAATDGLAGLSDGSGLDPDFYETDLSQMNGCDPRPPTAISDDIDVPVDTPTQIEVLANDDGLPNPLVYIVTGLPLHGTLTDVAGGYVITAGDLPYTLTDNGNIVEYAPNASFYGDDAFTFKADDGGVPPEGGESNEATILITVLYNAPAITTDTLPNGCLGQPYSFELQADGGQPELTWLLLPGSDYTEFDLGESLFSATGTGQGWQADDGAWEYTLPFSFSFYGQSYSSVWVCSNGFLDFAGSNTGYVNSTASLISNVRIAPLWDDLKTLSPHDIYVDAGVDYATIRWDAETYTGGYAANFAVTLFADGRIQFHYGSGNTGLTPTIGISSGNGTDYVLSMYDGATSLTDVNSVEFAGVPLLPAGLGLSSDGVLSGVPTEFGEFAPRIRVSDSLGRSDDALLSLVVDEHCAFMVGDMDCDGDVDFDDIDPFVLALGGQAGYEAQYPACNWLNADCDASGGVDFDDIDAFVALIGS